MSYSYIYLNERDPNAYGRTGTIENKGAYDSCKLFEKYEHRSNWEITSETLYLYKDSKQSESVTLHIKTPYSSKQLKHEEVYFNKHINDEFLALVLHFNDQPARYLRRYDYKIYRTSSRNITQLNKYDDHKFIDILINENDEINNTVTYQIDKQRIQYNDRIDLQSYQGNPYPGFTKYTHKPKSEYNRNKCFVLYQQKPLTDQHERVIDKIQNKTYTSVEVYFSSKTDRPLLLFFISTDKKECYEHKTSGGKYYFQELGEKCDDLIKGNNEELIKALKKAEFLLLNTVIVLIEKQAAYTKHDVGSIKAISSYISVQPDEIKVNKKSDLCQQLNKLNYTCYNHNLSTIKVIEPNAELKFYIKASTNYDEIGLYESNGSTNKYIYHKSNSTNLFVFFYDKDPRPLLLCYDGNAFKPDTQSNYSNKWVKVDSISNCVCDGGGTNDHLLQILHEVCLELNKVKLTQRTGGSLEQRPYTIQRFDGREIQIKVTSINLKCYRRYAHQPKEDTGYRLGKITYNNRDAKGITYTEDKVLLKVCIYHHAYDKEHRYPLLVELEFKGQGGNNPKSYFKLKKKGYEEWEPHTLQDKSDIEADIYNIRQNLKIDFEDKSQKHFDPSDCSEYKLATWAKIVSGVIPTAGLSGSGIAAYVFRRTITTFFRSFV